MEKHICYRASSSIQYSDVTPIKIRYRIIVLVNVHSYNSRLIAHGDKGSKSLRNPQKDKLNNIN